MNDISPKISGKLQLGESNSGPDSEGCGDPAGPWALHLCFSWPAWPQICKNSFRIDNSSSLETQAQEQVSNPKLGFLWAAGPVDRGTAHLRFSGIEPPQADTKHIDPCGKRAKPKKSSHQMED
ncbi:hypothetical protein DSO57_1012872 [Entomophthora muscae]|uniref:Uncharacterized protein n=1 Tax=Entomophthora muscae TaxID=34485 RepID=A0ACC2TTD0_9FUNG|nr:hypothetical protein DSO57_1012872 [Entomophthora muscae]